MQSGGDHERACADACGMLFSIDSIIHLFSLIQKSNSLTVELGYRKKRKAETHRKRAASLVSAVSTLAKKHLIKTMRQKLILIDVTTHYPAFVSITDLRSVSSCYHTIDK